jgi:hypothetical protein
MKSIFKTFVLGVVVAGLAMLAGNYRLIITTDNAFLARKSTISFSEVIVDTRSWGPTDWMTHPDVAKDLVAHGLGKLVNGKGPIPSDAKELLDTVKEKAQGAVDKGIERVKETLPEN